MEQSEKAQKWLKTGAAIMLAVMFCFSVFVLIVHQYGIELFHTIGPKEIILSPVTLDTQWNYMDNGFEPGVGNVWTTQRYDTANWKRGSGVFAAREAANADTADVRLKSGTGSGATCFFRCEFELENPEAIEAIVGSIYYSDAVLVYLNGEIIFAGNVPSGGYSSNQELGVADVLDEMQESRFTVSDVSSLRQGRNLLAVEVHQKDREQETASFCLSDFSLTNIAVEEEAPDISTMLLEQGSSAEEIMVSWQTSSEEFYQVEYLSEDVYDEKEEGQRVLMGRKRTEQGDYVNSVTLPRLKTRTVYYYRLMKVGAAEASAWQQFRTPGNSSYCFSFFGDPKADISSADVLQQSISYTGDPDFIMYTGGILASEESDSFRRAKFLKRIPLAGTAAVTDRQWEDTRGYTFTYQDTLFIMLNDQGNTPEDIGAFLREAVRQNQRKWIIVGMYENVPDMERARAEAYEKMFHDIGAALVLSGQKTDTAELLKKGTACPELSFVAGGLSQEYSAAWIEVRRNYISVSRYDLENGSKESEVIVR